MNDGYGHEVGDALLIEIARRLEELCRKGDFVARLGGDEFCVFLEGCDLEQATKVADRFRDEVASAFVMVGTAKVQRSASFGATELRVDQPLVDALYVADAAAYSAKSAGRNAVRGSDPGVMEMLTDRRGNTAPEELQTALDNDEITCFVQPFSI